MLRVAFAGLFDMIGGGKGLFIPNGNYAPRPPRQVVVLTPGEIPTTDIYLRGRLGSAFGESVRYVDSLRTSPNELVLGRDVLIVVVRHAPLRWLRWLEGRKSRLAGVAFLMDDDIPEAARASDLPLWYGIKTAWRYALARRALGRLCSTVWVSTPELVRRYAGSSPVLVEPEYVAPGGPAEEKVVYFYHGTWAHRREMKWLVDVVRKVQEVVPHAWFEIMGTDRVKRMYRGIARVRVVHPMPWKDYCAYAQTVRYQVGLAPCFDSQFNRARSHSKVFDITRLGAAGIYSNAIPYLQKIIHGETGLLCANNTDKWVAALILLLHDRELRNFLYMNARHWCEKSSSRLPISFFE